mgnify:CR=1 FL=1
MHLISLTLPEKEILEEYAEISPLKSIRLRAHAILMRNEALPAEQVARLSFRNQRTITRWVKEYTVSKLSSLFSGHLDNENASKLTREQRVEIKQTLSQPPDEYCLPVEFWDTPCPQ